jgi:ATP-dependent Clp protease protease subunit
MNTSTRFFNAKTGDKTLTLEIYDAIGADFFGGGITASSVSDAINNAGDFDSITLRLNSPGGDLFEGVAIHNLLKASKKPVNVVVDGLAASAASLIAMAGDTVTMGDGTMMMIHEAMAMAMGFADDMRKMADTLDTVTASAADLYVAKTGMSKDKVLDLMKAETWMNPQEAVENKFATAVSSSAEKVANAFDLSCFKNAPASLAAEPEGPSDKEADFNSIGLLRKQLELNKRK